jgi:hypothetical protein
MITLPSSLGLIKPPGFLPTANMLIGADILTTATERGLSHGDPIAAWNDIPSSGGGYLQEDIVSGGAATLYVSGAEKWADFTESSVRHYKPSNPTAGWSYGAMTFYLVVRLPQPASSPGTENETFFNSGASGISRRDVSFLNGGVQLLRNTTYILDNNMSWGAWNLIVCQINGSSSFVKVNNASPTTGTVDASTSTFSGPRVGAYTSSGYGFNGDLKAFYLYDGAHDADTVNSIREYLNSRFSVY